MTHQHDGPKQQASEAVTAPEFKPVALPALAGALRTVHRPVSGRNTAKPEGAKAD